MKEIILNDENKITVEHLPTYDIMKLWEGEKISQTYAIRKEEDKYLIMTLSENEQKAPRELIASKMRLMAAMLDII